MAVQQKHGLEKLQVVRQLKNYKDKPYCPKDSVLSQSSDGDKSRKYWRMASTRSTSSLPPQPWPRSATMSTIFSAKIYHITQWSSNGFLWLLSILWTYSILVALLVMASSFGLLKAWTTIASETFPKSIARLANTDLEFQVCNQQEKKTVMVKWISLWNYFS